MRMRWWTLTLIGLLAYGCSKGDQPAPAIQAPPPAVQPASPGVTHRLFATDVPTDSLALSIAIETLGGVSTVLIPRGTKLPASISQTFSTAGDDQPSVEVHVLQGERPMVADNRSLGRFQLLGIPPAARGVPRIQVTFEIDGSGLLTVRALDLATQRAQSIRIDGAIGSTLDKAAVDKVLREAEAARVTDLQRIEWSVARNKLEALLYSTRKLLVEVGTKLSAARREQTEQALTRADAVFVASASPGDSAVISNVTEALQKAVFAASEELYGNANP